MSMPHIRDGIVTLSYGEMFICTGRSIAGHMSFPFDGSGRIIPLTGGLGNGPIDTMAAEEFKSYIDYGMVFAGEFTLEDTGDGLKITGARDLQVVTKPDPAQQAAFRGIEEIGDILDSYRESHLKAGMELSLKDWQGDNRQDKTTADDIDLTLRTTEDGIKLTVRDGRMVELELEDGTLNILAYDTDGGKDAPVVIRVPARGDITVSAEDYASETSPETDAPEPY